ncbi:MAG: hypothetical protein IPK82_38375 [Polyangiaceae bacterium]|nr:hypothetical protein [Polyangiaceae bacterium]
MSISSPTTAKPTHFHHRDSGRRESVKPGRRAGRLGFFDVTAERRGRGRRDCGQLGEEKSR